MRIPYLTEDRIPPRALVESLPVREHLGWIWAFCGPTATFELPDLPEAHDPGYGRRWKSQLFEAHQLLILENGCDAQHFKYVHKVNFTRYDVDVVADAPHELGFRVNQAMRGPAGRELGITTAIHYVGPTIIFGALEFGKRQVARFIAAPLPQGPRRTLFHLIVFTRRLPLPLRIFDPLYQTWFARRLFKGSTDDYLPIWRDMDPSRRGVLVADDALQQRYRRFYRAHITSESDARDDLTPLRGLEHHGS